jgi:hypothetical protein
MTKALVCTACGAPLTRLLAVRSGRDPNVRAPEFRARQPLTPEGQAFKAYEPIERSYGKEPSLLEFTPQYWLNPADVSDAVRMTQWIKRLGGCCGEAGTQGPNQICGCGAFVGTLRADCWSPHVFIPDPAATEWRDEFQD